MAGSKCQGRDDVGNPQCQRATLEALEEPVQDQRPQPKDEATESNLLTNSRAQ